MKNLKYLFTALLLLCATIASAEEATINGIKYELITKAKTAKVIAGSSKYTGDVIIPASVDYNGATYSVTTIGEKAFYNCSSLTSITIPNSITSIGNCAFAKCSRLTSITIPNSVTSIGREAFYNCSSLESITIPNSVTSIRGYTFYKCSGLTSITIPNSVTSIGNYTFANCSRLTSITIPNSVTSIGASAFRQCNSLTSVTIPNSVTTIGNTAFSGCSSLASVTIPNSVTSIEYSAFEYCSSLESITIPNSVTTIGNYAFEYCSSLTSVTIPNSVTTIGNTAFSGCSSLASVTIGSGVKSVESEAFADCSELTDVYCLATTVPSTSSNAFNNSYPEYMTLHVPTEAINNYKTTAPWSSFGTIKTIEEAETPVCAAPQISYSNGKLSIDCETEGAEFITDVTCSDIRRFYDSDINFSATYNISVYATAAGYENSATVNATLCWIENGDSENGATGIINIPATAALITSNNGTITVNCSLNGETVAVYTTGGVLVGTTTIENGSATIATGLSKGTIAIIKIGEKSVKVII